jgi:hypothetical protein
MLRQALTIAIISAAAARVAGAHDVITTKVTFSKEVSRLIYKRCAMCHGEKDSIPLMTYEQARPWATSIKEEVLNRQMPPWQAIKGFGEFKGDRGLTQEEIETLSGWAEGGAPEGNPKFLPEKPKPETWLDPATPKGAAATDVGQGTALPAEDKVIAVRPKGLAKGVSVQIAAARPDGTFAPLLWIYNFNPDYARTYYYTSPVDLPAGTKIIMSPADAGKLTLFSKHGAAKTSVGGAR